jgi:Family of unknown function (DUF6186)
MTRALTFAGYLVIFIAMIANEVAARGTGRATLTDAVGVITRVRIARVLALVGWLWVGWHVFVRATH